MLLPFAAILLAPGLPDRHSEKKVTFVQVDGSRYRVTVRGSDVEVTKQAFAVRYSLAERDRLREAVKLATGCRIVDELAPSAKLKGRLACSS